MKTKMPFRTSLIAACLCCIFSFSTPVLSQLENTNWHFGNGLSLQITNSGPVLGTSSISATGTICPSSISDVAGNIMLYTDGAHVYNANGDIVDNGVFLQPANENVFVPNPDDETQYYLFRSNNFGVDYSLIDVDQGVNGEIIEDQKAINIYGTYSQLVCATIADGSGFWLITADNNAGGSDDIHVNAFKVDTDGVNLFSDLIEYFFFAGWNGALDDARISPDCSKITISYKGHYVCFLKFDNDTGEFYDIIYDGLDTGAGFTNITELEFSGNSSILYALGDYNTIRQYSLDTWTFDAISASSTVIEQGDWGNNQWTDLKLAPDGRIYLMNTLEDQIDAINFPDVSGTECELEMDVLAVPSGMTTYFPNLPNVTCAPPSMDLSINHLYECLGDETELWYDFPVLADSVFWSFDDPSTGALNTSNLDSPIHIFSEVGEYEVTFIYYLGGNEFEYTHNVPIYAVPAPDLGPDQIFCEGESITLDGASPDFDYLWSNDQITSTIVVTTSGDFIVNVNNHGCIGSDSISMTMIPYAQLDLGSDLILCDQNSVSLEANTSNLDDFEWFNGSTSESTTVTSSGVYWATGSNSCFNAVDSIDVWFVTVPTGFLPEDQTACEGDTIPVQLDFPGWDIDWIPGGSGEYIEITETGVYTATMTVGNCAAQDQIEVIFSPFIPLNEILMPNVFSPNGDAVNKVLKPFVPTQPEIDICTFGNVEAEMRVFSRWGNLLAEDVCSWDGLVDSDESHEGVYYYIVDLKSACYGREESEQRHGHVSLVRGE